jgi:hypothetical protein
VETAIGGFGATDAISGKLSSNKPSLIAGANAVAKRGHVGDEPRKGRARPLVVAAPPFRTSPSVAMPFGNAISEGLSLNRLSLTAFSALASGLTA